MMPAASSRRTRSRQGRAESPTRSANFWMVLRPSRCSAARILMSIASRLRGRVGMSVRAQASGQELLELIEKNALAFVDLLARFGEREPRSAVDLRKNLLAARARRPFEGEAVAAQRRRINIAFGRPGMHDLAAGLLDRAQRLQGIGHGEPRFFGKFELRACQQILPRPCFALGNRPGARILAGPERSSRVNEEHFR